MKADYNLIQAKASELRCFSGGPIRMFARIGQHCFDSLVSLGMQPHHRLLDIGCGCLRIGVWVIPYLDRGNYYGVEPNVEMLDEGLQVFSDEASIVEKVPRFSNHSDFVFSFPGDPTPNFDFCLARSIFTHASKTQMIACFTSLGRHMMKDGIFLVSYLPPTASEPEYDGTEWVGRSHQSDTSGIARYRPETIKSIAATQGFDYDSERTSGLSEVQQKWLVFRRR